MSTLKEKFLPLTEYICDDSGAWIPQEHFAKDCVKIADDYAIGFGEWCRDSAVRETPYSTEFTNDWELRSEQKIVTTKELLEMYKKEKGL